MCQKRPCWPTPTDVQQLITAGYADQLMTDWWFDPEQGRTVYLLTPAIRGCEGGEAPPIPEGACTFLDAHHLCRLHSSGLKPTEGKLALCNGRSPATLHEQIGQSWDNANGRELVYTWEATANRGRRRSLLASSTPKNPRP
jgi:hypothetical protein